MSLSGAWARPAAGCGRTADLPLFREQSYYTLNRQDAFRWTDLGTYRASSSAQSQPDSFGRSPVPSADALNPPLRPSRLGCPGGRTVTPAYGSLAMNGTAKAAGFGVGLDD